jgi:putative oxidoreductase
MSWTRSSQGVWPSPHAAPTLAFISPLSGQFFGFFAPGAPASSWVYSKAGTRGNREMIAVMMSQAVKATRLLVGLAFVVFGVNAFFRFIPVPAFSPFIQIMVASGYIFFVKAVEVIAGGLLLANRAVLLALVLLGADIANIDAYHALLDRRNWQVAAIVTLLYLFLIWGYRSQVKLLLQWRVESP